MSCVERELSRRKVFPCPICETAVKRVTLSTRSLDDVQCEKDTSWRRRVMKVYNKVESDFDVLADYNNYLEGVEDISKSVCLFVCLFVVAAAAAVVVVATSKAPVNYIHHPTIGTKHLLM